MNQAQRADSDVLRRFDWTTSETPSLAVVAAVSDEVGTDVFDMEPLNSVVDTDALNSLLQPTVGPQTPTDATVRFRYLGHWVVLNAHGRGYLYDQEEQLDAEAESYRQAASDDGD